MRKREIQRSVKRSLKGIERELKRIEVASRDLNRGLYFLFGGGRELSALVSDTLLHIRTDLQDNIFRRSAFLERLKTKKPV